MAGGLYWQGLIIGVFTFLIIGVFHPMVIKCEYYFGTRCWWIFSVMGIGAAAVSLFIPHEIVSPLLGVTAFSSFWAIRELFEQEKRVRKGWFPKNPKREYKF